MTLFFGQWSVRQENRQHRIIVNVHLKVSSVNLKCFVFCLNVMLKSNNIKMHGLSDIGPNVPAFLIKLWKLVNDPEVDDLICWGETGMSFIICNPAKFAKELLSLYYKHNNMASFIRQLNMYGFHKIVSEMGGIKNDKGYMEFAHQYFIKDHPYLLENIKRKLPNPKSGVNLGEQFSNANMKNGTQSEILAKILSDVNNLKGKQESWDARLAAMKRENETLWRELAIFRQKHSKQEQIINRLIHFIVSIVQPSRNVPLRRRYPLMLNGIQPVKKITKLSNPDSTNISHGSPTGPTIHEIDTSDVFFVGSPKQSEPCSTNMEFITPDIPEKSQLMNNENSEATENESKEKTLTENSGNIPEDWLEIQMIEGDLIDPLTPINPAEVNPVAAAATLKHLGGANKITAITSSESGKKNIPEKKIIYLTDINELKKPSKKSAKKRTILKLDIPNKKSLKDDNTKLKSPSTDLLLDLVGEPSGKKINEQPAAATAKRKASTSSLSVSSKTIPAPSKKLKKADSKSCVPELEIDDLEFLLTAKQPDGDIAEIRGSDKSDKTTTAEASTDPFLKLESLYNGTISEENLTSPNNSVNSDLENEDKPSSATVVDSENFVSKDDKSSEDVLSFEPESMAVVCQQPCTTDNLTRELTSHVDTIQGEIDYLKEMLKGEGYNFDPNSLPWLFNDDPLSYGVLSAVDEENDQKKNEEPGVSGNELMTYGAPNLMDLVDMIGSTPSSQDWTNILSPTSPVVTDLSTPAPSPSAFNFPAATKRRKK